MNKTNQLIVNPAKKEILETKVIQKAEPETYTIMMTKQQLMFFHTINANLGISFKESMGDSFYEKVNEINDEFKVISDYDNKICVLVSKLQEAYLDKLKTLGLDR